MESNRRYSEDEVQEILQRATDARDTSERSLASLEGMTLADLQEIGREVGIDSNRIAAAAKALDQRGPTPSPSRKFLGTTIGVGRTVYLERPLTEAEWHRLVLDLRETFDAPGKLSEEGSFRQWTNGNLRALLEPTESGERLRLSTTKGDAKPALVAGLSLFVGFAVLLVMGVVTDSFSDPANLFWLLASGAFFAVQKIRLPRWAATRELQMEGIAARLVAATEADPPAEEDHV